MLCSGVAESGTINRSPLTNDTFMLGLQTAHLDLNNWSMTLLSNLVWLVCSLFKKICTTGVEIGMPCFSVLTMAGGIMRV